MHFNCVWLLSCIRTSRPTSGMCCLKHSFMGRRGGDSAPLNPLLNQKKHLNDCQTQVLIVKREWLLEQDDRYCCGLPGGRKTSSHWKSLEMKHSPVLRVQRAKWRKWMWAFITPESSASGVLKELNHSCSHSQFKVQCSVSFNFF